MSGTNGKSKGKYYYHYTDSKSAEKIIDSGYIKASTDCSTDCSLGQGVYFTTKPPQSSTETLKQNNYDGAKDYIPDSKTQVYFRIPADQVQAEDGSSRLDRDVLVVPQAKVHLDNVDKIGYRKRYSEN